MIDTKQFADTEKVQDLGIDELERLRGLARAAKDRFTELERLIAARLRELA
jgi:hypothetical protein